MRVKHEDKPAQATFTDMETDGNNLTSKATKVIREMELYRLPGGSNK